LGGETDADDAVDTKLALERIVQYVAPGRISRYSCIAITGPTARA
jgi:hypothetical protein